MTNQPSTPPDRAKTVHYIHYNEFGLSQDNGNGKEDDDGGHAATNKACDIAVITAIIENQEKDFQQPPMPLPPPKLPPPPQRRPCPGTNIQLYQGTKSVSHKRSKQRTGVRMRRSRGPARRPSVPGPRPSRLLRPARRRQYDNRTIIPGGVRMCKHHNK